ncbi:ASTRA complex subunit [Boothiomyces macroporosus]|uniref:ASTRA complex subunit n=1 Tax=Boothiomyces macroporosus TaxID=261099 RepID=A0AAD5Y2Y5_9FUNG|nr:ASTRA complex subunit [Boothiomyces macroporosus]
MELIFSLRGHSAGITSISIEDNHLLSGDSEGTLIYWDLEIRRPISSWKAHNSSILKTAIQNNFYSQGRDDLIRVWNKNYELLGQFPAYSLSFCGFAINNEKMVYPLEYSLVVLKLDGMEIEREIQLDKKYGNCLSLAIQDGEVHGGFEDGSVVSFGKEQKSIKVMNEPLLTLDFEKYLYCAGAESFIAKIVGDEIEKIQLANPGISQITCYNGVIFGACWDSSIVKIGEEIEYYNEHREAIRCVSVGKVNLKKASTIVCIGSDDARISVWKLE